MNNPGYSGIQKVCSFVEVDPPPQRGGSDLWADIAEAHRLTAALIGQCARYSGMLQHAIAAEAERVGREFGGQARTRP